MNENENEHRHDHYFSLEWLGLCPRHSNYNNGRACGLKTIHLFSINIIQECYLWPINIKVLIATNLSHRTFICCIYRRNNTFPLRDRRQYCKLTPDSKASGAWNAVILISCFRQTSEYWQFVFKAWAYNIYSAYLAPFQELSQRSVWNNKVWKKK